VLKSEINYDEKGNKSGSARYWDDNGKLVLDENYVNGRLYINGRLF
jgi:antitoxin component YwqK of YwqJK toxin-antitoxin module